jgi:hypothetical protein
MKARMAAAGTRVVRAAGRLRPALVSVLMGFRLQHRPGKRIPAVDKESP